MAGLKYSRQRESIRNCLCSREDHPTADMIYASIRQEYPNISLGTVYRNLSLLVETGEIRKITTDGADRFDATLTIIVIVIIILKGFFRFVKKPNHFFHYFVTYFLHKSRGYG